MSSEILIVDDNADIRNIINVGDNLKDLKTKYGNENNGGKGVFLAKVFFGNNGINN